MRTHKADLIRYVGVVLTFLAANAWAGRDDFSTPKIREGSAYTSPNPSYRVVGMEDSGTEHTLYVVAASLDVLTQQRLNRIIEDIERRNLGFTSIQFYKSVGDKPQSPAFATYDLLGSYLPKDNKTYYGVAAKNLYGAWAEGPR